MAGAGRRDRARRRRRPSARPGGGRARSRRLPRREGGRPPPRYASRDPRRGRLLRRPPPPRSGGGRARPHPGLDRSFRGPRCRSSPSSSARRLPEIAEPLADRHGDLREVYRSLPRQRLRRQPLRAVAAASLAVVNAGHCGWNDLGTPERVARCLAGLAGQPHWPPPNGLDLLDQVVGRAPRGARGLNRTPRRWSAPTRRRGRHTLRRQAACPAVAGCRKWRRASDLSARRFAMHPELHFAAAGHAPACRRRHPGRAFDPMKPAAPHGGRS